MRLLFLVLFFILSLTEAQAEVYLSKEAALTLILGKGVEHAYTPQKITPALREILVAAGCASDLQTAHFFKTSKGEKISFALIDEEIGKHLPITYIVGITADGQVSRVEMMVFREIRGWEARERRFMAQFEGKKITDELKIGRTLKNVSGATLSSQAIARGTKRALLMWEYFFNSKDNERSSSS